MVDILGEPEFLEDSLESIVEYGRNSFEFLKKRIVGEFKDIHAVATPNDYELIENLDEVIKKKSFVVAMIETIIERQNYKLIDITTVSSRATLKIASTVKNYTRLVQGLILGFYISTPTKRKRDKANLNALEDKFSITKTNYTIDALLYPSLKGTKNKIILKPIKAALLSDIHIGSKTFCRTNFQQLLAKINADESIKYMIIAGDTVDGVATYPKQEEDLLYRCFKAQYNELGLLLSGLRSDITVIISPGNHDYTSKVEPQCLGQNVKQILNKYRKIHYVSNPGYFEIEGLRYLIYHGASYNAIIAGNEEFSCDKPWIVSEFVLDTRLLSPIPGITPIRPTTRPYHIVPDRVDIFHTGHLHSSGFSRHSSGTRVVCTGTWQHLTPYMDLLGYKPALASAMILNLSNLDQVEQWVLVDENTENYNYKIASLKEPII